jgi:nitrogen fixation NifU-like protein
MPPVPSIPDVPLEGLYGAVILDHYRNPRNRHPVPDPDVEAQDFNPFCGDRVGVQTKLDPHGLVTEVGFHAEGCSIIQASASMMTEAMAGKSLDQLEELVSRFRQMMQGQLPWDEEGADLGDLAALQVVRLYPVRIKCALLPWTTLEEGIDRWRSHNGARPG